MRTAVLSLSLFLLPVITSMAAPTPEEILATFETHPDFEIVLVAMEPQVFDPVDLEFDEAGRAFVLEMPGYPLGEVKGRVVLLEDTSGDGRYDSRTVFAEGFPVADSLLAWRGGLLVASPPDLLFIKDTTGDNVADVQEVLLTGFAVGNTQHNFNGLTYGLDNWVYGAQGGNGGEVYWPDNPDAKTAIRWQDFRIDFDNQRVELTGRSSGGFEISFDDYGRMFQTHNLVHISQLVFPGRYLSGVRGVDHNTLTNISDHEEGGLSRIFAIGEQETRVNHPQQSGYFSGASGITFYGGGAFGAEFEDNVFVCDVVLNLVHRDVLSHDGPAYTASRARDRVEFLASTDRHFRPVNLQVGPDGALYVLDMHRAVIEHPEWIPDEIQQHLDLEEGMLNGRIFRVLPRGGLPAAQPEFSPGNLAYAVAALDHPNRWWRDTAQRLLVEWQDRGAVPYLEKLVGEGTRPQARVHALWTLQGLGALRDEFLLQGLRDESPGVRENALQLAEFRLDNSAMRDQVIALAGDPDARVRMQTALTLGTAPRGALDSQHLQDALFRIAEQDLRHAWSRLALATALKDQPLPMMLTLLHEETLLEQEGAVAFFGMLGSMASLQVSPGELAELLHTLGETSGLAPGVLAQTLSGLANGLGQRGNELAAFREEERTRAALAALFSRSERNVLEGAWELASTLELPRTDRQESLLAQARAAVEDSAVSAQQRLEHLALLRFADFDERKELLFELLNTRHPRPLQEAAVRQLTAAATGEVADRLIAQWRTLGPEVRAEAGNMLLRRRDHHDRLLTALETGTIGLGEMDFNLERRRMLLWWSNDESISKRAEQLFSDAGVVTREAAIEAMRPALAMEGDPVRGREVFREVCAQCHVIGGEGAEVGPNLTDIFRKSKETLLHDILDPNAGVETRYISYTIETDTGDVFEDEIISGMIVAETDESVTLREAGGADRTIPRAQIGSMTSSGLSMMPEELEAGLTPQMMADLLEFLQQPR